VKLTRFILGLTLLASAIVVFELATEPYLATGELTQNKFWWLVGAGIGGVAGALIWGIILWLPLRFFRGLENAPEPLKFTLYTAAILVSGFIVFRLVVSPPMSQGDREAFIWGVQESCFPTQRSMASALNATVTDAQIREYCSCTALFLSQQITQKELRDSLVNDSISPSAQSKLIKAAEECRQPLSSTK